jgi:hypothetical protein
MSSPNPPAILYVEVWSQALPALALLTRRNASRPVAIIALVFLGSLVTDQVGRYVGHAYGNNLWVSILAGGFVMVGLLVALAEWQITAVERLTVRIAIIPCLVVYCGLVIFVEDIAQISRFAYPFYLFVVLALASWTLLRRSYQRPGIPIFKTDWFLILSGLALSSATTIVSTPIGAVLMAHQRVDLFLQVWALRAAFTIVAILLITIGTLRPPGEPEARV